MNISTSLSAALPPLPPLKKRGPSSDAMTIIKAMGGLQRLRRARGMIQPMQKDNQHFPCMRNHSNRHDLASRFAAVMPPNAHKPSANLGHANIPNARRINTMRSSEVPVRFHPELNTETMHDRNKGSLVKDTWPREGAGDASHARFLSRSNSSSRLRTTMTVPTTAELEADEDAMSWSAAWEDNSSNNTSRHSSERGVLGADSRKKKGSTWIEETSRPILDEYSGAFCPIPNAESRHVPTEFRCGIDRRESAAISTSQEHSVIANEAFEVQTGRMINWEKQDACKQTSIDTNDCYRPRQANEIGLVSDVTDTTFIRDRSTSQTTMIGHSGDPRFARTDDRSPTRDIWSFGEDIRSPSSDSINHRVHGPFQKRATETSTGSKRGRKRRLPLSLANKANFDRTAKKPRATPPTEAMRPCSVSEMEVCMDIVNDTNDNPTQTAPCFSPMDISCSRQNEHDAGPWITEPNAMNSSLTAAFRNCITDQMYDVNIWKEENGFQEPVMYTGNRSRLASGEEDGYDLTERGVIQDMKSGHAEDRNIRRRTRNGFDEAGKCGSFAEENMTDISQQRQEGYYSTRERERHACWETGEYQPKLGDVMHDITNSRWEANGPEWGHDAIRNAEENDMHDITDANVEEEFPQGDQSTISKAEERGSSEGDAMQVVTSTNEAEGVKRGRRSLKRVRNLRKRDMCKRAERNGFKSRKRRMRRMGRSAKRRHERVETHEPMWTR